MSVLKLKQNGKWVPISVGAQGTKGDPGDTGDTGPANTLTIGTVTSGVEASATITGEAPNQVLNLVLQQGEKGDSGVYVGAGDMPEGYNVQIDPSGSGDEIVTAENIQSALGYTPANSADLADKLPKSPANWEQWTAEEQAAARDRLGIDEPYELIDSFTIDEESVLYVDREVEPDGTAYNFKKVMVRITSYNTNMSGLCRILSCHINDNKFNNKYSAIYFNAGFNLTCVFCEKRNGFWLIEAVVSHTNGVTRSVYSEVDTLNTAYNLITGIRILLNNHFIVGTKIEIYGVRS